MRFLVLQHARVEHPAAFRALMEAAGHSWHPVHLDEGESPPTEADLADYDALWVMGGPMDVWEEDQYPWLAPEKALVGAAVRGGMPFFGLCFGHQILAEALGGRAVKSEKGWGVGVHEYEVIRRPRWMKGAPERVAVHALHQDQVVEIPDDATLLGRSPFCEYAMLAYGDPEAPDAISVQPHPEFDAAFMRELVGLRMGDLFPRAQGEAALRALGRPVAAEEMARWFADYLRLARTGRNAA